MTTLTLREKAKFVVGGLWPLAAIILVVGSVIYLDVTHSNTKPVEPTATPQIATVNPEVKHEEKIDVPLSTPKATVKAYTPKGKAMLQLPRSVIEDTTSAVMDSSIVSSSEKRQVVTQVLDTSTGETTTYITQAPDPWLSFENRGQVSVDVGIRRGSTEPVTRINLRQDLVQTKSVHWGVSASAYTDGDYFVGVGGSYRW
jgi:hypothetical protein